MNCRILIAATTLTSLSGVAFAESGFLSDYSKLTPVQSATGTTDLVYIAPGAFDRAVDYKAVMVDQPEILFSADSEYRGMKPQDILALASLMREAAKERLEAGNYKVVEQPGTDVLFVRIGLTDLYLKKKKRPVLAYTPIGAVAKVGADALKETLDKVDIIEMTFEAELSDSTSEDVLAAIVVQSGGRKAQGQKEQRMDMAAFRTHIHEYASRLRCRLDNAKLPEAESIDCTDPKARQARESTAD
jgi:hypothetical protein